MGLLKKISNTVKNVVSNPGNALEKVGKTALSVAAGSVAGGIGGGVVAGTREGLNQSKTGKSAAYKANNALQAGVVGVVTGAVIAGGTALATAGGGAAAAGTAGKGVASAPGGGLLSVLKSASGSVGKYVKAGGLSTSLISGAKGLLKGGAVATEQEGGGVESSSNVSDTVGRGVGKLLERGKKALSTSAGQDLLSSVKGKIRQAGILGGEDDGATGMTEASAGGSSGLPWWVPALAIGGFLIMTGVAKKGGLK